MTSVIPAISTALGDLGQGDEGREGWWQGGEGEESTRTPSRGYFSVVGYRRALVILLTPRLVRVNAGPAGRELEEFAVDHGGFGPQS